MYVWSDTSNERQGVQLEVGTPEVRRKVEPCVAHVVHSVSMSAAIPSIIAIKGSLHAPARMLAIASAQSVEHAVGALPIHRPTSVPHAVCGTAVCGLKVSTPAVCAGRGRAAGDVEAVDERGQGAVVAAARGRELRAEPHGRGDRRRREQRGAQAAAMPRRARRRSHSTVMWLKKRALLLDTDAKPTYIMHGIQLYIPP